MELIELMELRYAYYIKGLLYTLECEQIKLLQGQLRGRGYIADIIKGIGCQV